MTLARRSLQHSGACRCPQCLDQRPVHRINRRRAEPLKVRDCPDVRALRTGLVAGLAASAAIALAQNAETLLAGLKELLSW